MLKIGFVILNYLAYEATIDCVDSIYANVKENDNIMIRIVIVDNNSTNESFELLSQRYMDNKEIQVFKLTKNIGFAKGNNYGFKQLDKIDKFDYYVILNDDIEFRSQGFVRWVADCKRKYDFQILGPKVYSVNGEFFQSPGVDRTTNVKSCIHIILKEILSLCILYSRKIKKEDVVNHTKRVVWDNPYYDEDHVDMTLHGSFLIFSNDYFKYFKEPFHPGTFLYMEENLLRLRCYKKNLKMVYNPRYTVYHLQAQSTVLQNKSSIDKMIFRKKCEIKSWMVYMLECAKFKCSRH